MNISRNRDYITGRSDKVYVFKFEWISFQSVFKLSTAFLSLSLSGLSCLGNSFSAWTVC